MSDYKIFGEGEHITRHLLILDHGDKAISVIAMLDQGSRHGQTHTFLLTPAEALLMADDLRRRAACIASEEGDDE